MVFLSKQRLSRRWELAVTVIAGLGLAGCMSNDPAINAPPLPGQNNSGVYPTLSQPLQAATTQMSDEQAAAMGAKLQALADARKAGAMSEDEYNRKVAEMKKLGQAAQDAAKPENGASN